ncbi:MAG: septum formation initiator family protein [Candidatus Dependentiae bacterium]|nr:septum formation initiator family protein [Candidatus Dependentiae bacterium]
MMRYLWSRFLIFFLLFEGIAFTIYYNFGPCGMQALRALKKTKLTAQDEIEKIRLKNNNLREEIEEWKHGLFLQEKFAREKLAMQKENEKIYFK